MSIELVTGHAGAAHVSSADAGALIAGVVGRESYVLGSAPAVSMTDAYSAYIPACDLIFEGRHVRITGGETLTIAAGAQGATRTDLIVMRYRSDTTTAVESVSLLVKQGATTVDNTASILDGATVADVAIAKVVITNLTPVITWLLPPVGRVPLAEFPFHGYKDDLQTENSSDMWVPVLRGSASDGSGTVQHRVFPASLGNIKGIWMGSKTIKSAGEATPFMSDTDFKNITGASYDINSFAIFGMNGDWGQLVGSISLAYNPSNKYINMYCNPSTTNNVRVQYLILHW